MKIIYNDFEKSATWYGYFIGFYVCISNVYTLSNKITGITLLKIDIEFGILNSKFNWYLGLKINKVLKKIFVFKDFVLFPVIIIQSPRTIKFLWLNLFKKTYF